MEFSKKYPLVSIVSCFYNRTDNIHQSVESLLGQTYPNLEVILVDDGSTDDTLRKLSSYQDARIKLISHSNKGFVRTLREAISLSEGEVIAIHGSGDISFPTRIEKQANVLIENADVGVVGCYVRSFNVIRKKWDIFRPIIEKDQLKGLIERNPFTHGEVIFRRTCYEQVGGYREFFQFAQDRDLWLRMASTTRFYIVPEILYQREIVMGSVTKNPIKSRKQAYLSEFAIHCAIMRQKEGYDPLERNGADAFQSIERERNSRLSVRLRNMAHYYLADGSIADANKLISESISLDPSSDKSRYLAAIMSLAEKNNIFAKCLHLLFRWRMELIHHRNNKEIRH